MPRCRLCTSNDDEAVIEHLAEWFCRNAPDVETAPLDLTQDRLNRGIVV
jgi:hypothetical protein